MGQPSPCGSKEVRFHRGREQEKELVQTRLPTKIRVCIDYQKLNVTTRKDHFLLPFIDQILGRLAGHEYYYFLDGYSGYNQIHSSGGPRKDNVYMSIWDLCLSMNAFRLVQCPRNVSTLHIESILRHGRMVPWNLYGWFLHPWRFIRSMSSPSRTHPPTMCWKELDTKFGEMPLHGMELSWDMKSQIKGLKWIKRR